MDLPPDSSPWQKRAGVPSSHIACPRPPQSYSGCPDRPWLVRRRCAVDTRMDCIQYPAYRGAAEQKQIQAPTLRRPPPPPGALYPAASLLRAAPRVRLIDGLCGWLTDRPKPHEGTRTAAWKLRRFGRWPRLPNVHACTSSLSCNRFALMCHCARCFCLLIYACNIFVIRLYCCASGVRSLAVRLYWESFFITSELRLWDKSQCVYLDPAHTNTIWYLIIWNFVFDSLYKS